MKKLFCLGLASVIPLTSIPCFNLHRTISAIETTALISNLYSSVKIVEDKLTSKNELVEVNLQIPVLQGLSDLKLQKKINSMFKTDILSFKNEIEEMAKEYSEQAEEHGIPTIPYTAVTTYKVTCIKGDLLSLYIDYYQYTGGAHGITFRKAYNIDLTNGNKLTLKDLFKEGTLYKDIINDEINKQIEKNKEMYFPSSFKGISNEQDFYIDGKNLVIFFQVYELAPYAFGIPEFKIPLDKFKM
ncbi:MULTISPECIES: DUF3298 and DUF4163 domain-containing protein [Clostridium]|uniref:Anti-sigma-V factor RsiV n=2 Tax=Clostridium TaxID=1485 RepID=A0A151APW7_9CLOT|nr:MULTISPECIES: DUF3298 and DUF4163 domain-containing protein [Clostridium]KYH29633.1 anti-sigma-V factor RsiV [Clostridium colicanis DSM 13634]MBE6043935.1 DUF3298/DUF4163 domain-containing protein [Clostridium thermopalmarium]PRR72084.1 Anti-sigma-V factor RsiV [Clostridium thermopalmarium DSM 5974]PVZ23736.1 uncharacterized protein DUF3298 [Clostridium thermopalmarium DSM 5974]